MEGFGKDEITPVFLTMVGCTGSETQLSMCPSAIPTGACATAGVTCGRSSSETMITLTPQLLSNQWIITCLQILEDVLMRQGLHQMGKM